MRRVPNSRMAAWVLLIPLGLPACRNRSNESSERQCYLELKRESPGRLKLAKPVSCAEKLSHYLLAGPPAGLNRPAEIDYLDPDGLCRLSYRIDYDQDGRPTREERIYRLEPTAYQRYRGRSQEEFSGRAPGRLEVVRIITELDSRGRPVKIEKFEGADLQYSVVSEFTGERLRTRSTYGRGGRLLNQVDFFERAGRRMERMRGPTGKVLMEREVEDEKPEMKQDLDTSGGGPVHSPVPSD